MKYRTPPRFKTEYKKIVAARGKVIGFQIIQLLPGKDRWLVRFFDGLSVIVRKRTLLSYPRLKKVVGKKLDMLLPPMPDSEWEGLVQEAHQLRSRLVPKWLGDRPVWMVEELPSPTTNTTITKGPQP